MEILEIKLFSDDLAQTENFYCKVLGLPLKNKSDDFISFIAGKSILTFIKSNNVKPVYHFAFNIPQNKISEALDWVCEKVPLIPNEEGQSVTDFKNWNAKAFYFYDNNRNILEFIARFDLDIREEKAFDATSLQSISEIGIVTDPPLEYAEHLSEEYKLDFFSKGPKTEKFAVLGDDNGLLIFSKTGRHWYPTDVECKKFFAEIKIEKEGRVSELEVNKD